MTPSDPTEPTETHRAKALDYLGAAERYWKSGNHPDSTIIAGAALGIGYALLAILDQPQPARCLATVVGVLGRPHLDCTLQADHTGPHKRADGHQWGGSPTRPHRCTCKENQ